MSERDRIEEVLRNRILFIGGEADELSIKWKEGLKLSDENAIDWEKLKCYGCGEKATRVHKSMVVPVCDRYPECEQDANKTDTRSGSTRSRNDLIGGKHG